MGDIKRVEKGLRQPRARLIEDGRALVELVRAHRERLTAHGFGDEKIRALEEALGVVTSPRSEEAERYQMPKLRNEATALEAARALLRRVEGRLPKPIRDYPFIERFNELSDKANDRLRTSARKMADYFDEQVMPVVHTFDDHLRAYFKEGRAAQLVGAIRNGLLPEPAEAFKEVPEEILRYHEAKGLLAELIGELRTAARAAFAADRTLLERFLRPGTGNGHDAQPPSHGNSGTEAGAATH